MFIRELIQWHAYSNNIGTYTMMLVKVWCLTDMLEISPAYLDQHTRRYAMSINLMKPSQFQFDKSLSSEWLNSILLKAIRWYSLILEILHINWVSIGSSKCRYCICYEVFIMNLCHHYTQCIPSGMLEIFKAFSYWHGFIRSIDLMKPCQLQFSKSLSSELLYSILLKAIRRYLLIWI